MPARVDKQNRSDKGKSYWVMPAGKYAIRRGPWLPSNADAVIQRRLCYASFTRRRKTMAHEIIEVSDNLVRAKLSGVMQIADQKALQAAGSHLIAQGRKARVLVVLENFEGWEKSPEWENIDFLMKHGDDVERMAIVGDPKWKDDALVFVAKGLRSTQIEYFVPSALALAEAWIRA